jgi:hypothetical protein
MLFISVGYFTRNVCRVLGTGHILPPLPTWKSLISKDFAVEANNTASSISRRAKTAAPSCLILTCLPA